MYIKHKWNKKYDSKSAEFAGMSLERILFYELEAKFTIESDDNQAFSEDSVPIYSIVKVLKDSKSDYIEICLEGWGCNPFLVIQKKESYIRVKNNFIDFKCRKENYELQTERFIFLVDKEISEMGFDI